MSQSTIHNSNRNHTLFFWGAVILALCGFIYFYQVSLSSLLKYWNDYGTYSHGYLTVLLAAYLVYVCAKEGRLRYSGPSGISAICIFLISIIWIFSYLAKINTFQMLCIPFFMYFTLTYFCGFKNYRVLLIPVFILLFTIPIWSSFLPYLQDIAVNVTNKLLSFSSLDYRVLDNKIIFSRGIFQVEESCSGLRYLLVGVLLAVVYGFLNYQSYWSTLLLVIAAVIIMLLGNFIRILVVIALGVIKGMDYPLVQDHENLGWIIFAFLLIPMFTIARFLKPDIGLNVTHQPVNTVITEKNTTLLKISFALVCYLVVISISPLYASYLKNNIDEVAVFKSKDFELSKGWVKSNAPSFKWSPNYSLYSSQFSGQFKNAGNMVDVNMFLYTKKLPSGELINSNNQLADDDRWLIEEASYEQDVFNKSGADELFVNKVTLQSTTGNDCFRVWYWFDVGGNSYTKKWRVKLQETLMIFSGKSGSTLTSISTNCNEKDDEILKGYIADNISQVKNLIIW